MELSNIKSVQEETRCKVAHDKMVEVQQELAGVEREISDHLYKKPSRASADDEARAYLKNRDLSKSVIAEDKPLEELYKRRRVISRALQIARSDFEAVREAYSREMCASLMGSYRERCAQPIADALKLLVLSARAERDFRSELEAKGIMVSLPPAAFSFLGFDIDKPDSGMAARWISDARKAGLIR